jgi:class 3 adenylate cyclase
MESHALPGTIQVTERAYERLRHRYELQPRGMIEVKGKGSLPCYLLTGSRADPALPIAAATDIGEGESDTP